MYVPGPDAWQVTEELLPCCREATAVFCSRVEALEAVKPLKPLAVEKSPCSLASRRQKGAYTRLSLASAVPTAFHVSRSFSDEGEGGGGTEDIHIDPTDTNIHQGQCATTSPTRGRMSCHLYSVLRSVPRRSNPSSRPCVLTDSNATRCGRVISSKVCAGALSWQVSVRRGRSRRSRSSSGPRSIISGPPDRPYLGAPSEISVKRIQN